MRETRIEEDNSLRKPQQNGKSEADDKNNVFFYLYY